MVYYNLSSPKGDQRKNRQLEWVSECISVEYEYTEIFSTNSNLKGATISGGSSEPLKN